MKITVTIGMLVFVSLVLVGCGTANSTSSELVAKARVRQTYCIASETKVVEQRIQQFLDACYMQKGETLIPVNGAFVVMKGFSVEKELTENLTRFSVRNDLYYSMSAEIAAKPQACGTILNIYAVSGFWSKTIESTAAAARGEPFGKCM
jgi:hypothetical protein